MAESKIETNKVLLWTNPNVLTAFGAQTVSLDLSGYIAVFITARYYSNTTSGNDNTSNVYIYIGEKGQIQVAKNNDVMQFRNVTVTTTGVTFTGAYTVHANAPGSNAAIPIKIYGIK